MEPRDPSPSEDLPHKNVDGAIEESWSSDEEEGPATAGYTLLQNESGSDEEESSFLAPDESVPTMDDDGNEIPPEAMKFAPNHGLKPLTAEEEAKLRKEAFDNFDRNYDAVRLSSLLSLGSSDSNQPLVFDTGGLCCCEARWKA